MNAKIVEKLYVRRPENGLLRIRRDSEIEEIFPEPYLFKKLHVHEDSDINVNSINPQRYRAISGDHQYAFADKLLPELLNSSKP